MPAIDPTPPGGATTALRAPPALTVPAGPITRAWLWLNARRRPTRWALKAVIFAGALVLTLFPPIWRLPTWCGRIANMNAVLDPDHPWLAELELSVRQRSRSDAPLDELLKTVQAEVNMRVPYAFDWETWGVVDWLPTVEEVARARREDCDGRAVVAASLLRRMGYSAHLVNDVKHTWVAVVDPATGRTDELMSPGAGAKSLVSTETGTRTVLDVGLLANLGRGLAYGLAVFPLQRELILLAVLCLLIMHPRSGAGRRLAGCGTLLLALLLFRAAGASADGLAERPAFVWLGVAALATGWGILAMNFPRPARPDYKPQHEPCRE